MSKKLIGIVLAMMLLFGVVGLTACNTVSLEDYKTEGKAAIQAHADGKIAENGYTAEGLAAIQQAVATGNENVETAESKTAVDTAVTTAKAAINEVEREDVALKQGVYTTDDGMVRVVLHGENEFALEIMVMSHLPMGKYEIKNGKLILHYIPDVDLCFDIGIEKLIFSKISDNGQFAGEWIVNVGTVFNLIANEN